MVVVAADVSLVAYQFLAAWVWTAALMLPVLLSMFSLVASLLISLVVSLLALFRLVMHAQVRRIEFSPAARMVRSIVFACPTHAVHGVACAALIFTLSGGAASEVEMYAGFILAWLFSTAHLLQQHQQLKFDSASMAKQHRLQRILKQAPTVMLPSFIGLNMIAAVLLIWSPMQASLALALCVSELVFSVVVSEPRMQKQVDFDQATNALLGYAETGSLLQTFQCMPLLLVDGQGNNSVEGEILLNELFSGNISIKWDEKRKQVEFDASSTRFAGQDVLVKLSALRFDLASQAVYYKEAMCEGKVFAQRKHSAWLGVLEANRLRAFQYAAKTVPTQQQDLEVCINACLDILDAQALKLASFAAVLSKQKPRNPETGLDETEAYGQGVDSPKDQAWVLHNAPWTGRMWFRRLLHQDLFWEFDPIYEESARRLWSKKPQQQQRHAWLQRNVDCALLDEFELCVQVSKTVVALAKQRRNREVTELVRFTMSRFAKACEDAEKQQQQKDSQNLFYAMSFCLERDLQVLNA